MCASLAVRCQAALGLRSCDSCRSLEHRSGRAAHGRYFIIDREVEEPSVAERPIVIEEKANVQSWRGVIARCADPWASVPSSLLAGGTSRRAHTVALHPSHGPQLGGGIALICTFCFHDGQERAGERLAEVL